MEKIKESWTNYALATGLNDKDEAVQVATLLTVIGEESQEVFSTFTGWTALGDDAKIEPYGQVRKVLSAMQEHPI